MKEININSTIYELTEKFPELIEILAEIGFIGVKNSFLRNTVGKKTNLVQGCKVQGKNIKDIISKLEEKGFVVKGLND
jgi:predicted transcriptional regulator